MKRLNRIQLDLMEIQKETRQNIGFLNDTANLNYLLAWIRGPEGSPYPGGIYWLQIGFSLDYPNCPPKITFLTKIYHPSVYASGKVCMCKGMFSEENWNNFSLLQSLEYVISVLRGDIQECVCRKKLKRQLEQDPEEFVEYARIWRNKYASPNASTLENIIEARSEKQRNKIMKLQSKIDELIFLQQQRKVLSDNMYNKQT